MHHVQCVASSIQGVADVGHLDALREAAREQVRSLLSETQQALHVAEPDPALDDITLPLHGGTHSGG